MVDTITHKPLKLMDRLRQKIRFKHYSLSTERVYSQWVRQYILFHDKQHPKDLGEQDIVRFLNYLANDRNVAASTQNQVLSALVFLYKEVLEKELGDLGGFSYA
ncbi:MAG: site-specific integrase, partial [Methylophilaceae bacterium]